MFSVPLKWCLLIVVQLYLCSPVSGGVDYEGSDSPKYRIYEKEGVLFCTGATDVAIQNNKGADKLVLGQFVEGIAIFKEGLEHAPLFYPFLYNIGIAYMRNRQFDEANVYITKAMHIVPQNPKIYILRGELSALIGREGDALFYFRKALEINSKEIEAIIKIGNIYVERNQLELALRYFYAALQIAPHYPNAVIGLAKVHFKKGEYYKALIRLKSIDISKAQYDKSYHYYYAESAFKLKDYKSAFLQYEQLLAFKNDVFFLTHSYARIEHKRNLAQQFAELEHLE